MANETAFKRTPQVSVLVPVYNGEKYLGECLDSILAQNFEEMEILIADDGSTDGSQEVIERYAAKDKRIRWWRNPVNLGLSRNFNHCLQVARYEYVKYVLQDDKLVSPSAIAQMAQALDANPSVSLVASASYILDPESKTVELRNSFHHSGVIDGKKAILHCVMRDGNYIGEPSVVMFRRNQAGRGYDERYCQLVDLEFWFHLLENGSFAYLADPLCAFRRHDKQQSAFNRGSGTYVQDELMLAQHWIARPWLRHVISRQVLFEQIYNLRKRYGERAQPFINDAMTVLKAHWYALYWLKYKISKPFKKLKRSVEKRWAKLAAVKQPGG
jgi:glycosyltransferase involved in cell wall biosynthesis